MALTERSAMKLHRLRGLIALVLFWLLGLPRVTKPVLHRGIRQHIRLSQYQPGNVVTWYAFSSTTPDLATTQQFMTDRATGRCEGTLLQIHGNAWGYDVQPFSFFPNEEEILLEPEIDFKVISVLAPPDNGLIIVDLDMLPCLLLLENLIPLSLQHQPLWGSRPSPPVQPLHHRLDVQVRFTFPAFIFRCTNTIVTVVLCSRL